MNLPSIQTIGEALEVFVGDLDELDPSVAHFLTLKLIHSPLSILCRFKESGGLSSGATIVIHANFDAISNEFVVGEERNDVLV